MKGNYIPQIVQRYADHDMIKAHTKLPAMANDRVALLYAFLKRNPDNKNVSESAAVVTSLVQLGLDTHDMVEMASEQGDDRNMRSRQLKVLAGDYFSSRFYNILAQTGQVAAIQSLSRAVREVNRMKMTMLVKMNQWKITAEGYLQLAVELRECLFRSFDGRMLPQDADVWKALMEQVSLIEVLNQERERANRYQSFEQSWSFWEIYERGTPEEKQLLIMKQVDRSSWNMLLSKYHISQQLTKMLHKAKERYDEIMRSLSDDLYEEISQQLQESKNNGYYSSHSELVQRG